MKTERFTQIRQQILSEKFDVDLLSSIWRQNVKSQLRSLQISDLYDYYDFNYSIEDRSLAIRNEILSGNYKSENPLIFKVEKKLGICRHLMIPQPSDALVTQTIVHFLSPKILKEQPTKNSYYSQKKHKNKKPHEVENFEYDKEWRKQWVKMQKSIYNFTDPKDFIIVTDLTNYFDSIDLSTLRETILGYAEEKDEVLIDLLFRVIEELSWKPDYLPYKKHGLPTINIEPIRLLGHSFLYEIDNVLNKKSDGNFARWMDDFTIATDSLNQSKEILSSMSDVLKSRGLALNLSKTFLYTKEEFIFNFLIEDNRYLDDLSDKDNLSDTEIKLLKKKFKKLLKNKSPQHWSKVAKRYITIFGKNKIDIISLIEKLYLENPGLRDNIIKYLILTGYSKKRLNIMINIFNKINVYDDISLFKLSKAITTWNIPVNVAKNELKKIYHKYSNIKNPLNFYSLLWLRVKYDSDNELREFIFSYEKLWKKSSFLRRQVIASCSRLITDDNKSEINQLIQREMQSGIKDSVSISSHLLNFKSSVSNDNRILSYLFPTKLSYYSLERFLVLCSALNSEKFRKTKNLRKKIDKFITDEHFLKIIDKYKI